MKAYTPRLVPAAHPRQDNSSCVRGEEDNVGLDASLGDAGSGLAVSRANVEVRGGRGGRDGLDSRAMSGLVRSV